MAYGAFSHTALIAATIYNVNRGKGAKLCRPDNLNPFVYRPPIDPALETEIGFSTMKDAFRSAKVVKVKARKPKPLESPPMQT
jgi:hypothetical protein